MSSVTMTSHGFAGSDPWAVPSCDLPGVCDVSVRDHGGGEPRPRQGVDQADQPRWWRVEPKPENSTKDGLEVAEQRRGAGETLVGTPHGGRGRWGRLGVALAGAATLMLLTAAVVTGGLYAAGVIGFAGGHTTNMTTPYQQMTNSMDVYTSSPGHQDTLSEIPHRTQSTVTLIPRVIGRQVVVSTSGDSHNVTPAERRSAAGVSEVTIEVTNRSTTSTKELTTSGQTTAEPLTTTTLEEERRVVQASCSVGFPAVERAITDTSRTHTVILRESFLEVSHVTRIEFYATPGENPQLYFGIYEKRGDDDCTFTLQKKYDVTGIVQGKNTFLVPESDPLIVGRGLHIGFAWTNFGVIHRNQAGSLIEVSPGLYCETDATPRAVGETVSAGTMLSRGQYSVTAFYQCGHRSLLTLWKATATGREA